MDGRPIRRIKFVVAAFLIEWSLLFGGWIAVAMLRASTESKAGGVALLYVIMLFLAVVLLSAIQRMSYRRFWHNDHECARGDSPTDGFQASSGEPFPPAPQIDWPLTLRFVALAFLPASHGRTGLELHALRTSRRHCIIDGRYWPRIRNATATDGLGFWLYSNDVVLAACHRVEPPPIAAARPACLTSANARYFKRKQTGSFPSALGSCPLCCSASFWGISSLLDFDMRTCMQETSCTFNSIP